MNDFQIYNKPFSKITLQKSIYSKVKSNNFQKGFKNIIIPNSNYSEKSSQYGNYYYNSKKNILDENNNNNHITYNSYNNKNLFFPANAAPLNQNINNKYKDYSLISQNNNIIKKKYEAYGNKSKKEQNYQKYNSKENFNGIILNKVNLKLNIYPKKANFKLINNRENNISLNLNKNIGISISKSKSKSKSKNSKENKSYNNKINNNINRIILGNYLKLYKVGEKEIIKKAKIKNKNTLNKESWNYNTSKISNEGNNSDIHKMSSINMEAKVLFPGLRKKNKSSNLLISNLYKPKN